MLYNNSLELIGQTPIVRLGNLFPEYNVYAKLEMFNLSGSVKDRIALNILKKALADGKLQPGGTVIEATSGNTGIGLSAICRSLGLKCVIVMPASMSIERRQLMKIYGAELVLTDAAAGTAGAIAKAEELRQSLPNAFIAEQFSNPANPEAHLQTAREIIDDFDELSYLVAGIGTGGTISTLGTELKKRYPGLQVIGIEPEKSPIITQGFKGPHKIQGIGAGFIPDNLNLQVVDKMLTVSDEGAYAYCKELAKTEGIFAGISSGAALQATAAFIAASEKNPTGETADSETATANNATATNSATRTNTEPAAEALKKANILVILPDSGMRYLSDPALYE